MNSGQNFIGHGLYNGPYLDKVTSPNIAITGVTQSYTFTFIITAKPYIKYVEIENRKDGFTSRINGAILKIYGNVRNVSTLINTIILCIYS
jgi:hypothetical protein